ncbi:uncharacterized protein LOC117326009 isoform X1 [Pecten maximus]|uniref:uncharacterized protein LOC117326009 isoform X1 n=1 Tax=Pecten maximus TaxID=6579 RepID=UPI001458C7BD|nr:uncharacterized protein LOC117326009 isoform X1 [Pecten maximus]
MVKVSRAETRVKNGGHNNSGDLKLPRLVLRETKVKRRLLHPVPDSVKLAQLRQYLRQTPSHQEEGAGPDAVADITSRVRLLHLPDIVPVDTFHIEKMSTAFAVCEANNVIVRAEKEVSANNGLGIHKPDILCTCNMCETFNMKSPKLLYRKQLEKNAMGVTPRLLTQLQLNQQMNMLRAMQDLSPIQMYSSRMIRFKLMQNHRRQTMPMRLAQSSSSTPTVPYSTADILYGNEVRQSPQVDDIRQNSFIDYNPKDRERLGSRDLSDQSGRRPGSKGGSRKSLSIEKVSFGKESEDNLRPILPSTKQTNQYRPNGLRSSLLKGEPLFSSRSHTSGKDADELIAMGTIWSPGAQQSQQPPQKNLSGPSQSANGPGKTVTVGTGSNSSTTLSQTRKYGSNVKPIMVQNAPASGMKNNIKDGKLEPKYTDPLVGAPASFQQRLMELSALEAETVRYERSKKVKKKVKQDRDS